MRDNNSTELYISATFPSLPVLRGEWNVSPDVFDAFLAWLDADRDKAGRMYEDIRRRLIKIFTARGCHCPEDLADETISRVIAKAPDIGEHYQGDPGRYFGGVARNVFHEYARRRTVATFPPQPDPPGALEQALSCLDKCLAQISGESRTLILRYYEGEKSARIRHRNEMAREMGAEPNALRIRAYRIRAALQECVGECLAQGAE